MTNTENANAEAARAAFAALPFAEKLRIAQADTDAFEAAERASWRTTLEPGRNHND